jgi:hypothetical protein
MKFMSLRTFAFFCILVTSVFSRGAGGSEEGSSLSASGGTRLPRLVEHHMPTPPLISSVNALDVDPAARRLFRHSRARRSSPSLLSALGDGAGQSVVSSLSRALLGQEFPLSIANARPATPSLRDGLEATWDEFSAASLSPGRLSAHNPYVRRDGLPSGSVSPSMSPGGVPGVARHRPLASPLFSASSTGGSGTISSHIPSLAQSDDELPRSPARQSRRRGATPGMSSSGPPPPLSVPLVSASGAGTTPAASFSHRPPTAFLRSEPDEFASSLRHGSRARSNYSASPTSPSSLRASSRPARGELSSSSTSSTSVSFVSVSGAGRGFSPPFMPMSLEASSRPESGRSSSSVSLSLIPVSASETERRSPGRPTASPPAPPLPLELPPSSVAGTWSLSVAVIGHNGAAIPRRHLLRPLGQNGIRAAS